MSLGQQSGTIEDRRKTERRSLVFSSLDQVMPDVELALGGYRAVGNWNLGQICNHLAIVVRGSVEGVSGRAPWILRKTVGPLVLKRIFAMGQIKAGMPTSEKFVPGSQLDDRAEAEALRAALGLFTSTTKPLADHPFFGTLSREQWTRLHYMHSAHHLSFLWPHQHESH